MKLNDKIKGALFGYALGDALGVGTEFMTKDEASFHYPEGCRHFSDIIRDAHRSQFDPGEWTCDTEQVVRITESILSSKHFDLRRIASDFKEYVANEPYDIAIPIRRTVNHPGWENHPMAITHQVWSENTFEASNEALGRSLITGMISPMEHLEEETRKLVLLTHDDSRCVSSATMLAHMFHSLIWDEHETDFDRLHDICKDIDHRTLPYLNMAHDCELEEIDLDDEDTMQYTRKSMAAGLWPIWHLDKAEDFLYRLIDEGGDADTNAALSGAMAGIKYGYDSLPDEKELLVRKDYLSDLANRITKYLEER